MEKLRLRVWKTEINGRGDPLRWPRDTLYPQKLSLTSPTSGSCSVGVVRLRTKATEFSLVLKVPCNRPWMPIGFCDVEAPTFSTQSAHRWRWGCQPYAPAALYPPGRFLVLISVRGWVNSRAIVRLEWLGQMKNPMTSSGIKRATFRLVA
jgi:hypothetical protein